VNWASRWTRCALLGLAGGYFRLQVLQHEEYQLRSEANRIRRIEIVDQGRTTQTAFSRGTLRIVIEPRAGVAGRPSSARIVRLVADDVLSR